MSATPSLQSRNQLISSLSDHSLSLISQLAEPLALPKDFRLASQDRRIDYVYFPESGIASVTVGTRDGLAAEAGMFGREGFSPTAVAVGGEVSPHNTVMQTSGKGYRIDSGRFRALLDQDHEMERVLLRYMHVFATQVSYTALSNAAYHIDVRLARWLLMCHDRVDGDEFQATHHCMSLMLAVRRPSVTTALHDLEGKHLIRSTRSLVHITDRAGLEALAGEIYGRPEKEYGLLFRATPPKASLLELH
jgi:CRP-like cAMP-binding protein